MATKKQPQPKTIPKPTTTPKIPVMSKKEKIARESEYWEFVDQKLINIDHCVFLKFFSENLGNISAALRSMGVLSRKTFYNWYSANEVFKELADDIRDSKIDIVESMLQKNIMSGNVIAQIFYLKTIGKSRGYVERTEVDSKIEVVDFEFEEV
jgi:hypothetical protein